MESPAGSHPTRSYPPNGSPKLGREAINACLCEIFEHYSMMDLTMPERQVKVSSDLAVDTSTYRWNLVPRGGGEPIRDQANWVGIWERGPEVRGIWNSARPSCEVRRQRLLPSLLQFLRAKRAFGGREGGTDAR